MTQRWTLVYQNKAGEEISLYNLTAAAIRTIIPAQFNLGSTKFEITPQDRLYTDEEIARFKEEP